MNRQAHYAPPYGDQAATPAPQAAREQAAEVGRTATESAGQVAGVAKEQARQVASETTRQARDLFDQGVEQLRGQAREGQQRVAGGLRELAEQFRQMCDGTDSPGMATSLVRQASERASDAASWLESRQPGDLIDEVRNFARRRPGTFLAASALAGALVGRLTRNVMSSTEESPESGRVPTPRSEYPAADTGQPGAATAYPVPPASPMPPAGPGQLPLGYPSQPAYGTPPPYGPGSATGPAGYSGTGPMQP